MGDQQQSVAPAENAVQGDAQGFRVKGGNTFIQNNQIRLL
jgi:hypothetical protein